MDDVQLLDGGHGTREKGVCVMEAVAWFAGEAHSDRPHCACPLIAEFARRLNDRLNDEERQRLKPLIPALALSRADWPIVLKRAFLAADYAVRVFTPMMLEAGGHKVDAARLRKLNPICDRKSARRGRTATDYAAEHYADYTAAHYAASAAAAAYDAANHAAADYDAAVNLACTVATHAAAAAAAAAACGAAAGRAATAVVGAGLSSRHLAVLGIQCLEKMLAIR